MSWRFLSPCQHHIGCHVLGTMWCFLFTFTKDDFNLWIKGEQAYLRSLMRKIQSRNPMQTKCSIALKKSFCGWLSAEQSLDLVFLEALI